MVNKIICLTAVICFVLALSVNAEHEAQGYLETPLLSQLLLRKARSPEGGSVQGTYTQDANGRQAEIQYNQNLYTSKDGRGSIDAYANAQRNIDENRNNYGGGITGTWSF